MGFGYNSLWGVLILAGDIWAIINIFQSAASNEKKLLWTLVVILLPVLGLKDGEPWLAIGASGGRRILPAVFQLISFQADFGLGLEAAFHEPRIDTSIPGDFVWAFT